jgi:hypothetical protein
VGDLQADVGRAHRAAAEAEGGQVAGRVACGKREAVAGAVSRVGAVAMQRILHVREGRLGSNLTLAILLDQVGQLLQRSWPTISAATPAQG